MAYLYDQFEDLLKHVYNPPPPPDGEQYRQLLDAFMAGARCAGQISHQQAKEECTQYLFRRLAELAGRGRHGN